MHSGQRLGKGSMLQPLSGCQASSASSSVAYTGVAQLDTDNMTWPQCTCILCSDNTATKPVPDVLFSICKGNSFAFAQSLTHSTVHLKPTRMPASSAKSCRLWPDWHPHSTSCVSNLALLAAESTARMLLSRQFMTCSQSWDGSLFMTAPGVFAHSRTYSKVHFLLQASGLVHCH